MIKVCLIQDYITVLKLHVYFHCSLLLRMVSMVRMEMD